MPIAHRYAEEELQKLRDAGLLRTLEPLITGQGPVVELDGKLLANFSSNDYLSLAGHPSLAEAARAGIARYGTGAGASRLVVGHMVEHQLLEERIAKFARSESALLFNSGYDANTGVIASVVGEGDVVLSDALNHASIIDGCRLSRARTQVYRHLDVDHLRALLKDATGARRRLIVTDTLFSMDGDTAPLADLVTLAREHDAMLMVDEAHAIGVFGDRGAGLADALGVEDEIDFRIGTLSKALGSFGGWVAASKPVCDWLLNRARSLIYTTGLPPSVCAASYAAIEILEREPERREHLWKLVRRFADGLRNLGFDAEPRSPIFPVVLGTPERALEVAAALREEGILAKAIRPPTVPVGTSRVRFSLCAGHSEEQIDRALAALAKFRPA